MKLRSSLLARFACAAGALTLSACASSPPVQEMSDARQVISAAAQAEADRYAPHSLADARRLIAQAEQPIRDESWGTARTSAVQAKNRALNVLRDAQVAAEIATP